LGRASRGLLFRARITPPLTGAENPDGPSLAQALEITLRGSAQARARECPRPGRIEDVLERSRDQHLPDTGVARRSARHAIQHSEAAVDEPSGGAVLLDGAARYCPKRA
jgi:hypothetical protein